MPRLLFVFLSMTLVAAAEHRDVGLTQKGMRIDGTVVPASSPSSPPVLLIGGLAGNDESSRVVAQEIQRFEAMPQTGRPFNLLGIALANPDGARLQFPPAGVAYRENSDSHSLWRWIGITAPAL